MADFAWPIVSMGILALLVLIPALVIWKTLKDKKSGFPLADERTKKLNWKAGY
jgi:inner membrane protein involved in colicin E2 resistance